GFFSASLLLQAALGPAIGKAIDRHGGCGVLVLSNLVLGAGLIWLALAHGPVALAGAWALLGVGMALGLYDPAFATLTALYGREARGPITGITLIAGFASTVGWPLSALLNDNFGWRGAFLGWAALELFVCLPVNRFLIPLPGVKSRSEVPAPTVLPPANGLVCSGCGQSKRPADRLVRAFEFRRMARRGQFLSMPCFNTAVLYPIIRV